MLAKTGKHISELQQQVWEITGRMYSVEDNLSATAAMRIIVPQRVKEMIASGKVPYPLKKIREDDGTKIYFEGDSWALLRFSGTEPVLRIFAEAETPEKARQLADWLKQTTQ
jgi:phosphomannomutase